MTNSQLYLLIAAIYIAASPLTRNNLDRAALTLIGFCFLVASA